MSEVHRLTRYDSDDGEPYGELCHWEIRDDHDAAGNPMALAEPDETGTTGGTR
jgi:hypothetical protein